MIGQLFINQKDAWETWGVVLEAESYNSLRKPANNKVYTTNKFNSQHGEQLFIVNPRKESRDVILIFVIEAETEDAFEQNYTDFIRELDDGLLELVLPHKDKKYDFITLGYQDLISYESTCKLSVQFSEPYSVPVVFESLSTEATDLILTEDGETILI